MQSAVILQDDELIEGGPQYGGWHAYSGLSWQNKELCGATPTAQRRMVWLI